MKANETKVDKFLATNETTFAIPVYQRNYDWTLFQCKQLLHDIIETGKNDKTNAHFIGSIVYVHDDVYTASGLTELTIIDGQQRLTFIASVKTGTIIAENFVVYGDGHVFARDIKVNLDNPFSHPDYVFENTYKLMPLNELEQFLKINKHLPNVPSAKEVAEKNGINLGEMSEKQLQKIEELTLYVIELNRKIEAQELKIQELQNKK